jgi:hypothetical protein
MCDISARVDITNRRMERMCVVIRGDNMRYDGPHTRQCTPKSLTIFYNYTFIVPTSLIITLVNVRRTCYILFQKRVTMKERDGSFDFLLCYSGEWNLHSTVHVLSSRLTTSIKRNDSWLAKSLIATETIPHRLQKTKCKSMTTVIWQINPIHTKWTCYFKVCFNIIITSTSRFSK